MTMGKVKQNIEVNNNVAIIIKYLIQTIYFKLLNVPKFNVI